MTLWKRLRVLKAALFQDWHVHACIGCNTHWVCCAPKLCQQADLCATCEAQKWDDWVKKQEAKMRKRVAS